MKLSKKSIAKLYTCHPDIVKVIEAAIVDSPYDFSVTHGYRSPEDQAKLYAKGRTEPGDIVTYLDGNKKKSKHNLVPSMACDIAIFIKGKLTWEEPYYRTVANHIKIVAKKMNIAIKWGGDWEKFKDNPHFEL
jgi:peptidoglycan L-alanyl-D-glutamate endopeptidase CwlK